MSKKELSVSEQNDLLTILRKRFEKNINRHREINWNEVQLKLQNNSAKLWSLNEMEKSGGEPDVVGKDEKTSELIFMDCSPESPKGRRSICYDAQALESRKEFKPADSAVNMANNMGIEILTEEQYRYLQQLGNFDTKTSSWVATPPEIRKLGGAVYCDRRYNHVFLYHNGAESYYAVRGFRGILKV